MPKRAILLPLCMWICRKLMRGSEVTVYHEVSEHCRKTYVGYAFMWVPNTVEVKIFLEPEKLVKVRKDGKGIEAVDGK